MHSGVWTFWWQNSLHNYKDLMVHLRLYLYNILLHQWFVIITYPNSLIWQRRAWEQSPKFNSKGRSKIWASSLSIPCSLHLSTSGIFSLVIKTYLINEVSHQNLPEWLGVGKYMYLNFIVSPFAPLGERTSESRIVNK